MTPQELFQAGKLAEAVAAAVETVKKHPANTARRGFYCELLCFTGELEKADKHLEALAHQEPQTAIAVAMFRQQIRAEMARREFYTKGRMPEFLGEPSDVLKLNLEASIALREGNAKETAEILARAEEQRIHPAGKCDGVEFDDLRDLDDTNASFFEVLTSTGKYYWIPMEAVEFMEFHPPERPRDLLWRRVHMVVAGGPDGEVFIPALYYGTHEGEDDQLRLGRGTDWTGGDGSPVRGVGLRMLLFGEADKTIMEPETVEFDVEPGSDDGQNP